MSPRVFILRRNSGTGGAEKAAERLASCLEKHLSVQRMWANLPYQHYRIPGKGGPPWWRSWRYTHFIDGLQLKRADQIILSLEYGPDCDIYRAGDGIHRRNVLRRYGDSKRWMLNPWHWFAPRQERKCLHSASLIVANSKMVERQLRDEYPHLQHKMTTIYNGYNPARYKTACQPKCHIRRQLNLPANGDMLLLAGHGFERKGLLHAVRLLGELVNQRRRDAYLVIAGLGNRQKAETWIHEAGLRHRVYFVGAQDHIEQYYQAASFMVLPTRNDPFSNACLEALACGCPVITSRNNGAAEVLTEYNGWIMDNSFSDSEIQCAADFTQRFNSAPEAIAASVSHLTENDEAQAYLAHIRQLLNERNTQSWSASTLPQSA